MNRLEHARCVICNSVNHAEVATEDDDLSYKGFYEVEYGESGVPAFVCFECQSFHSEVRSEWSMIDDLEDEEDFDDV